MKEELKIFLLQFDLIWEDPSKNRLQITNYLEELSDIDIILLPELFSTGFSVSSTHLAEPMDGETVTWMKSISEKKNAVLCGTVMIKDKGHIYNRLLWVEPDGKVLYYNKRHLFCLIQEDKYFTSGSERLILDYKGWKICPMICYDLRFPVFSRNDVDYDLLLYLSNWPSKRIQAWDILLKARAIENQSYVIGVNRVGVDGHEESYPGKSQVIDPQGEVICMAPDKEIGSMEFSLFRDYLFTFRKRYPFLSDRDSFSLHG
mgnify:FL=1